MKKQIVDAIRKADGDSKVLNQSKVALERAQ